MEFSSSDAILLDVRELGEVDRLVVFLSRLRGKKRGVAKAARRKYSRFAGQLQPLARCRIGWVEREGAELVRIRELELTATSVRLQRDLEGILIGSYLADQVDALAPENQADDPLFRLLESTLGALEGGIDRDLATRYFEVWVLRLSGVFPAPEICPGCGGELTDPVLPRGGEGLVCGTCAAGRGVEVALSPEAVELLRAIGKHSLPATERLGVATQAALRQLEAVAAGIRRHFLERELRSYEVMKRTLAAS